jgi:hypothetical protein
MKKYLLLALALFATGISLAPSAEAHDRDCYRPRRAAYVRGYQRGVREDRGWNNGWNRRQMAYRNGYGDARWGGGWNDRRYDRNGWW